MMSTKKLVSYFIVLVVFIIISIALFGPKGLFGKIKSKSAEIIEKGKSYVPEVEIGAEELKPGEAISKETIENFENFKNSIKHEADFCLEKINLEKPKEDYCYYVIKKKNNEKSKSEIGLFCGTLEALKQAATLRNTKDVDFQPCIIDKDKILVNYYDLEKQEEPDVNNIEKDIVIIGENYKFDQNDGKDYIYYYKENGNVYGCLIKDWNDKLLRLIPSCDVMKQNIPDEQKIPVGAEIIFKKKRVGLFGWDWPERDIPISRLIKIKNGWEEYNWYISPREVKWVFKKNHGSLKDYFLSLEPYEEIQVSDNNNDIVNEEINRIKKEEKEFYYINIGGFKYEFLPIKITKIKNEKTKEEKIEIIFKENDLIRMRQNNNLLFTLEDFIDKIVSNFIKTKQQKKINTNKETS